MRILEVESCVQRLFPSLGSQYPSRLRQSIEISVVRWFFTTDDGPVSRKRSSPTQLEFHRRPVEVFLRFVHRTGSGLTRTRSTSHRRFSLSAAVLAAPSPPPLLESGL